MDSSKLAYRPAAAAEAIGVSRSVLFQLLRRKELGSFKCGASTLIPAAELRAWIERQMEGARDE